MPKPMQLPSHPPSRLKICHRKPWQNEGLYIDASLRGIAGRPPRGTGSSPRSNLQDGVDQLEGRPLCTTKTCASVTLAFTGDERWFPERNLYGTPLSVRAWRNFHAIRRARRYGGAWPKGGSGALSWPESKTRSRKVTESERKAAFAGLNNIAGISERIARWPFRLKSYLSPCNNRRRQPLSCLLEWEVTMHDLPQPLLAHLQREARDARDQARASRD
jgi:hypothetical protein